MSAFEFDGVNSRRTRDHRAVAEGPQQVRSTDCVRHLAHFITSFISACVFVASHSKQQGRNLFCSSVLKCLG